MLHSSVTRQFVFHSEAKPKPKDNNVNFKLIINDYK